MPEPVTALRNLGPAFAEACARAGIHTADELRALGTDEAYERILRAGGRPHFIGFYVLEMALQGRPWNDCKGEEKVQLRVRFDRIKARVQADGSARICAALDEIGVIEQPGEFQPTNSIPAKK